MSVRDLIPPTLITVAPSDTLVQAMRRRAIGCGIYP
jgi:hypothetical protein